MHLNEYREQLKETQLQLVDVIAKIENAIGTPQELKKQLAESNNKLNDLETQVQFLISEQKGLISELADREIKLTDLYDGVSTRDNHLEKLNEEISTREGMLKVLNDSIAHRDEKLSKLLEEISARDEKLKELQSLHYASQQALMAIRNSKIWRWTYVIHSMPFKLTQTLPKANHISEALKIGGGFLPTIKTAIRVLRKEGVDGIRWRLRNVEVLSRQGGHLQSVEKASLSALSYSTTGNGIEYSELIPYYIDPSLNEEAHTRSYDRPLTVVLIPHGDSLLEGGLDALSSMKSSSSLRVLVPKSLYQKSTKLKKSGFHKNIVCFEPGLSISDIFRDELVRASEETSNILYVQLKNDKDVASLHSLIGAGSHPGGSFEHCWNIVAEHNSAIVYESDYRVGIHDLSSNSLASVQGYLDQRPVGNLLDVEDASVRAVSILFASSKFFEKLDNCYSPFSKKIESPTGDLNSIDIFEYLLPNLLRKVLGRKLAVQQLENVEPSRYYEEQIDFSKQKLDGSIKVLCYYLPQFHYTEENDLWHGKNFTEWTKVKGSTPLFEGHYQQHIPHPDIGYYLLTSAEALKRQADQMKKAGVHGQVFYHYWFTGRMILEKPAQMLLANPDIDMPFCFCWANENWTRRWDGNEREILLGQTYSAEDALRFIEYLIPFFKDPRYIKVEGRPVLSIYRPSSIPDIEQYLEIWGTECEAAGLKRPYMVATLTRGAVDPNAFHMDAAVERVLHDWTDGAVPDMRGQLRPYDSLEGSVLSYEKVADFYSLQKDSKDFTYFRSIVPVWDNAARYGNRALVVHGSTPILFQNWFDELVKYTKNNLPEDRQFIFVNAWNEWAEGAHLEPDVHFGYAHLNAIGRVLSTQDTESEFVKEAVSRRKVRIEIANALSQSLEKNEMQRRKFSNSLLNSKLLSNFDVTWSAPTILGDAPLHQFQEGVRADCVLVFKDACIFDAEVLEKLVSTALQLKTAVVPTIYGDRSYPLEGAFNTVSAEYQRAAPVVAYFGEASDYWASGATLQSNAWVFHLPADRVDATLRDQSVVTTIIRLHKSANIGELANALYSLNAMRDCIVQPMIAAQDLSEAQIAIVNELLGTLLWEKEYPPLVRYYQSEGGVADLRSKMLNESLKSVETHYAAFLDYDDLLYSDSYSWLLSRLRQQRVAIAFGRVYSTEYESASGRLISRRKAFEYGFTFEEFVGCNHAPLHSFLLDLKKIDLSEVIYHDLQKYMEDYYLTLQIFSKSNADWTALKLNNYVGDYLHSIDRTHTLAINDESQRKSLLEDEEYMRCEAYIQSMRKIKFSRMN